MNNHIAKEIFQDKYPQEMSYESYLFLLEEGFEILKKNNDSFNSCTELQDLKAIRVALEYRMELLRQYRRRQLRNIGQSLESC